MTGSESTPSGEGNFDVAKDPDRPFIVKTSYMDVQALGTSFCVQSFVVTLTPKDRQKTFGGHIRRFFTSFRMTVKCHRMTVKCHRMTVKCHRMTVRCHSEAGLPAEESPFLSVS